MRLLEANSDGDMIFNWFALPEPYKSDLEARDRILEKLKDTFGNDPVDGQRLFEINEFALQEILKLKK